MNITQRPQSITPSGNPIIYVVNESNYTAIDFKYLLDVYVGGERVTRLKRSATNEEYQYFDIQSIMDNYITYTNNISEGGISGCANNTKDYTLHLGTYSGTTEYIEILNETGTTINFSLDRNEFLDYDYNNYIMSNSSDTGLFLTDYTTQNVTLNDYGRLGLLNINNNSTHIYIFTYNINDGLIDIWRYNTGIDTFSEYVIDFPSCPSNINSSSSNLYLEKWDGLLFNTSVDEVITTEVSYYKIFTSSDDLLTGQPYSNTIRYNIVDRCSKYDYISIVWMNKYGVFDHYGFNMKFRENREIERFEYTKKLGRLSSGVWSYDSDDFEKTNYLNNITYNYIVSTEYIDNEESNKILDLIESNIIYARIEGEWVGVLCSVKEVSKKRLENRDLVQYDITLDLNYKNKSTIL